MRRNEVEDLAVPSPDFSELGVADPYGIFQHGFKYWLKVAWGAADNLQHIRCCRLLLQRLAQILGTRAIP
jgi:hypothetical protein